MCKNWILLDLIGSYWSNGPKTLDSSVLSFFDRCLAGGGCNLPTGLWLKCSSLPSPQMGWSWQKLGQISKLTTSKQPNDSIQVGHLDLFFPTSWYIWMGQAPQTFSPVAMVERPMTGRGSGCCDAIWQGAGKALPWGLGSTRDVASQIGISENLVYNLPSGKLT